MEVSRFLTCNLVRKYCLPKENQSFFKERLPVIQINQLYQNKLFLEKHFIYRKLAVEKDAKDFQCKQQRHQNNVIGFYLKIGHLICNALQNVSVVDFEQVNV